MDPLKRFFAGLKEKDHKLSFLRKTYNSWTLYNNFMITGQFLRNLYRFKTSDGVIPKQACEGMSHNLTIITKVKIIAT